MSSASDARRIAAGPLPSQLVRARHATRRGHRPDPDADPQGTVYLATRTGLRSGW